MFAYKLVTSAYTNGRTTLFVSARRRIIPCIHRTVTGSTLLFKYLCAIL